MSFWKSFVSHSPSAIDSIFEKETFTLEELLNSEELLQECKAKNQKLLDFILLPENLEKLFGFLMDDTQSDDVDQRRPNYPHIVTEILCLDICDILNAIFEDSKLLDKIWSFFDAENHFAKQNGNYICRVAGHLLQKKVDEVCFSSYNFSFVVWC